MMIYKSAFFAAASLAFLLSCNAHLEPVRRPVFTVDVAPLGEAKMAEGIKKGIADAGWTVFGEKQGVIDAELALSGERAIVYITYSDIDYSINLKHASEGLDYDGERIHKRYNYWVDRLNRAIKAAFKKM